jgi:hypothetical protein
MKRLLTLALFTAGLASAQLFDPDPRDSNAQQVAEMRAIGAMLGIMPPPIGWFCLISTPDPNTWSMVECQPDPALIEQQRREQEEWLRRLRDRAGKIGRRR